jgi:LuxR family transcriptional regulator, maltose regulon positive regulatory protein
MGLTEGGLDAAPSAETGGIVFRPRLFEQLATSARIGVVSAPAGSGKTVLMRSWIRQAGLADPGRPGLEERVAWVSAAWDVRDPQRFWLSVVEALRGTAAGSVLVQPVSAAPGLDGWTLVERLLADLAALDEPTWLVIDDVHDLGGDTLRQLELLLLRAPPQLRFVLATRHEVRLGLHRLRLEGELTEIRQASLRFSMAEARELFQAAGVGLAEPTLAALHERTEGWAAGLRLAALSLAGRSDPAQFAAEFSGTERTVAEYLLAEVLDQQSEQVRRMLLRTSILPRVNGELADLLTGGSGGERLLQDLEQANAFVVSLDAARTWFRYHQMFAALLQLELRRTEPGEVTRLHQVAARWFTEHRYAAEAVRHAQAARDWGLATRLLADHWPRLQLAGQASTVHELLAGFPAQAREADAELAMLAAGDELVRGSLEAAERYLDLVERRSESVPDVRRGQFGVLLGVIQLMAARHRGDAVAAAREAQRLLAVADTRAVDPGRNDELRATVLISLGLAETWAAQSGEAERHLGQGVELARRTGWPFLEFTGLAYQAAAENERSFVRGMNLARQAFELAERHGWTDEPGAVVACAALAYALACQVRPEEAEPWVQRAERAARAEGEPSAALPVRHARGLVELAGGRYPEALAAFQAADQLAGRLAGAHLLRAPARALLIHALTRLGEHGPAELYLDGLAEEDRQHGEIRVAEAALRNAQGDPLAATTLLAPVLDAALPAAGLPATWLARASLVEAIARDALGDPAAAGRALERALDLTEPSGALLVFVLDPAPGLLDRHAGHRTAHAAMIAGILGLLAGHSGATPSAGPQRLLEPLRDSEIRILRYLPTNLTLPEIARELHVSHNTVKTHIRSLHTRLGAHSRAEAVDRARALGLLAPAAYRR